MEGDGYCRAGNCAPVDYARHAAVYIRKVGRTTSTAIHRQREALGGRRAHPVAGCDRDWVIALPSLPPVSRSALRSRCRCRRRSRHSAAHPSRVSDGVGNPVVVTVKLPAVPTVKVVLLALVIAGAVCAAGAFNATSPRITSSLGVPVPNVELCAPAPTPTLYWIICPFSPTKLFPKVPLRYIIRVVIVESDISASGCASGGHSKTCSENQIVGIRSGKSADRRYPT